MEWSYSDDRKRIVLDKPPVQKLRITGHRLSSVLGLNEYQSEFGAWVEITKLAKLPFEDTKYTLFGKAVEQKIIDYVGTKYPNVMSIEEYYGNVFEEYRYNNFKDESDRFGGVIDAVATRNDKKTLAMICECKTSSHAERWANNQVQIDYLLQGALYAYLKGLDRVLFACTFPSDIDYAHPENYEVNDSNTILVVKKLSDIVIPINGKYMNIEECMQYASQWWDTYIETGISPEFDEKADKDYLDIIRASKPCEDNELIDVCEEAIKLAKEIKELEVSSGLKAKQDLLKTLEASIKETMIERKLNKSGKYTLSEKKKIKFDEKRLEKENPKVYNEYTIEETSYTLTKNMKEEEE
jgi:predicted phage-related endonuclease